MKPAVAKSDFGSFGIFVITFQNILAAQNDLAEIAVRDFMIIIVEYSHLISDWQAARARAASLIRRIESRTTG